MLDLNIVSALASNKYLISSSNKTCCARVNEVNIKQIILVKTDQTGITIPIA